MGTPRINYYTQTKGFFKWVETHRPSPKEKIRIRPTHITIYWALLNLNNIASWDEWFYCTHETIKKVTGIYNNRTYYRAIRELEYFGFIKYQEGKNENQMPYVSLTILSETGCFIDTYIKNKNKVSCVENTSVDTQVDTQLTTQVDTQVDAQ